MNHCYPFINTPLKYDYNALEPFIDEKTMHLHHDKHLQTYIDNLNSTLKSVPLLQTFTLDKLLTNYCKLPNPLNTSIKNNAGGVFNHLFFFNGMQNPQNTSISDYLMKKITKQFDSFDEFKNQFKNAALSVFGSGYAWLVIDRKMLKITTTPNQDTPLIKGQIPILNIDVWEHAYYLKHYNVRAAYIDDWFNVINWTKIEKRLLLFTKEK